MFKMFPLIKPYFNRFQMIKAQIKKKIIPFVNKRDFSFLVILITDYFYSYCFRSRVTKLSSRPSQRSGPPITSHTNLGEATRRWVTLALCVTGTCTIGYSKAVCFLRVIALTQYNNTYSLAEILLVLYIELITWKAVKFWEFIA